MILILWMIVSLRLSPGISGEFKCFPTKTNIVTFRGDSTQEVPLPTVRLIQGFWPSQWAMQYAAYVYLTETIGLNVTMYPMDDPNAITDKYDMLFEMWDITEH
eukprot:1044299_1